MLSDQCRLNSPSLVNCQYIKYLLHPTLLQTNASQLLAAYLGIEKDKSQQPKWFYFTNEYVCFDTNNSAIHSFNFSSISLWQFLLQTNLFPAFRLIHRPMGLLVYHMAAAPFP